jgi:hypothetical protein
MAQYTYIEYMAQYTYYIQSTWHNKHIISSLYGTIRILCPVYMAQYTYYIQSIWHNTHTISGLYRTIHILHPVYMEQYTLYPVYMAQTPMIYSPYGTNTYYIHYIWHNKPIISSLYGKIHLFFSLWRNIHIIFQSIGHNANIKSTF